MRSLRLVKCCAWGLVLALPASAGCRGDDNGGGRHPSGSAAQAGAAGSAPRSTGGSDGGHGGSSEPTGGTGETTGGKGGGTSATGGEGGSTTATGGEGGGTTATGGADSAGAGSVEPEPGVTKTDKVDLLLVVDNSPNTSDKTLVFSQSVAQLIGQLVHPPCVDEQGQPVDEQPVSPAESCPEGTTRRLVPVNDLHVGVITSSLGGHGNPDMCEQAEQNDHGRLLDSELRPDSSGVTSGYEGLGFLAWDARVDDDPEKPNPPGTDDVTALVSGVQDLVMAAGAKGCGYEAPLEAWYRFLADPAPAADVARDDSTLTTVRQGSDEALLAQRAAFLRPDSALVIAMVSDENDCSVMDSGYAWLMSEQRIYRGTEICDTDPNDPCCTYCGYQVSPPGCLPLQADPGCQRDQDTARNLRCWDQKRRFGVDFLYPVTRYVAALKDRLLCPDSDAGDGDCRCRHAGGLGDECDPGKPMPNPIYQDLSGTGRAVRDPSLVTVISIVGVPWQDLATDDTVDAPDQLRYKQGAELDWDLFLGDPTAGVLPEDALMWESVEPRTGPAHPITGIEPALPTAEPWANPINGHEWSPISLEDLQYACIFDLEPLLPTARDCNELNEQSCDCLDSTTDLSAVTTRHKPVCQAADGSYSSVQTAAKAYPGLRHLELVRALEDQGFAASICPKVLGGVGEMDPAYGYNPAFAGALEKLERVLE